MKISFFDMLGIDPALADRASAAAALWPDDVVSLTPGINVNHSDPLTIVNQLFQGTTFANVRPGVDPGASFGAGAPGQLGFAADMAVVGPFVTSAPFYLRAMPDLGIQLVVTDPVHPARVFFAVDGRGHEIIIDRLPVKIFLKPGLASALAGPPVSVGSFDLTAIDSFAYTLSDDAHAAELDCYIRLQLTTGGDVIIEPTVPISLGPVRWMGLPAKAVYDIGFIPAPNRRDYLEWAHNDVGSFIANPPAKGALSFRSIEVDFSLPPFSDLRSRLQNGAVHLDNLELVLEDVAVPVTVPVLPIPSHGTFGFRRKITDRADIAQAYSLSGAPVQIPIYGSQRQGGNGGSSLTLQVEKFFFRTGDVHALDPADQPQIQFQAALIFQTTTGKKLGPTMGIDDEWTITAGMVLDIADTPLKFTIADTTVGLVGFKFGVSVGRLGRGLPFKDSFEALGDLFVRGAPTTPSNSPFKIVSLTGKPLSVVLKDLGYKLGHVSLDGLQMPDGMQLVFANTVFIIIEELGWVEEPNGTPYFSFSGGVAIGGGGGNATPPAGDAKADSGNGFGIRVRRLRFRLNDDGSQPLFKIDGVFLKLKYGTVDIEGFGYISDYVDSGWAIKEWGFGVKVKFDAIAMQFSLAAEFIKGHRKQLDAPHDEFDYFLAALSLGFLPAGPIGLYDIRALVADNMAPNLDSAYPDGEGMVLLKWHQNHDQALSLPANRTLADWLPEKDSFAFGVGCGFSLNGCGAALHLDIFIFFAKSKADTGILIVGELFLLKNPKPIAFVAIEYDIDKEKFGVMIGVDLSLGDFASGNLPDWLAHIARLTGTIYFGNQPWSFAIGQLADQSTWLALKIDFDIWITVKLMLGVCVEIVDGGPKGFGLVFTLSAGSNWGIGSFLLWGTFGLIVGTWKTGSDSSGLEFWIGVGFKINLFWVFSFGAEINLKITYLGKHPWFVTLHAEIKIDTPWFLPDVTFTFDKTWQEPLPFDTASVTQCLSSSTGKDPVAHDGITLLTPGLSGALGDAKFVYSFNQLVGLQGARIADPHLRDDIPVVSVDATIALDLAQPVSNDSAVATATYDGTTDTGVQKVQDITLRYGLQSIAVRRAPRFGPTAGVWSDLLTDAQTAFTIGGAAPQTLTFAWDVDSRADGKLAPKRLLVNSSAPYSFAVAGAQNDEEAVRRDLDFPCCDLEIQRHAMPKPHVLEFSALPLGGRTPRSERFSGPSGAWWRWTVATTPVVALGDPVYPSGHVARVAPRTSLAVGYADLPEAAANAQLEIAWERFPGVLFFEGYDGLTMIAQRKADLHAAGNASLTLSTGSTAKGMTRVFLRVELDEGAVFTGANLFDNPTFVSQGYSPLAGIGIFRLSYVTLADVLSYVGIVQRCKNGTQVGPPGSDASGKLAFLPNHDYEIVVTAKVDVGTKDQGTRTLQLSEASYFRTKGLPGLNAAANVGDDIRLHVDRSYPLRREIPLYRAEPCVLAFENSLSSVLPIDRAPAAGDPPEKAQMFPLELNVDRVVSQAGLKRLTVPGDDWIAAHRVNPYPRVYVMADPLFAQAKVRYARSTDALVLRHEAVLLAVPSCGPAKLDHASQVLLHEPIDEHGTATAWEAATGYRATVRQKGGAFTERSGFDDFDLGAFIKQADGGASAVLWSVDADGNLVAPPAAGGRHYATCGEPGWDHLQVHARIDLRTANLAGIAVAVGDGTPVPQAVLATVEPDGGGHALVVRVRDGAGERELGRAALTVNGPFLLAVTAYDDVVRATVGGVSVDAPRGAVRAGRVALIAQGPAAFAGIAVGALDIYSFEFSSSKYHSFAEHLASYDGTLGTLASGAFGGAPATIGPVLAAHGGAIAPLMAPSADPQERQKLFDAIVRELGLGLRKDATAVSISRVNDAGGTFGFLVQSPEPISLTRDVVITMTHHVRVWVPGWLPPIFVPPVVVGPVRPPIGMKLPPIPVSLPPKVPVPGPGPVEAIAASALATLKAPSAGGAAAAQAGAALAVQQALPALRFDGKQVVLAAKLAAFGAGERIARVVAGPGGNVVEIYDAPAVTTRNADARGVLREIVPLAQAAQRADLSALAALAAGSIAVLPKGGGLPPWWGHWEEHDVPVPLTPLANGAETALLLLAQGGAALAAGSYTLHAVLDRDRWQASAVADPEQHYHDEQTLTFHW